MVQRVAAALIKADPAHVDDYQKSADAYVSELQELNTWIQSQVTTLPESRRKLVTTHDTFGYFAERFGFEVSSVMGTVSSEVADPSAAQIAAIIEHIRREQVPAIFAENILNPQLTEQVAREAGVRVVPTLFTDALGEKGSDGESYLQMMRSNVTKIVESLK
jgi:ABC-type Zn uptake system ZnuABC Zn-binding protein ZnuA